MKKITKIMLACIVALSVWAAGASANASASAQQGAGIEIRLSVGEEQMWVNGESIIVKPPFTMNSTTLVPLRVITTSFGAEPTWIADTQTIILEYGGKSIELQNGSREALVDGVAQQLPVAPQIVDGTTMVPLRFILENFGADVHFNEATGEITIKGSKQAVGNSLFEESKTKIGDSYEGWTMAYPSGLVKQDQSFNGDWVTFVDAKGEYTIHIIKDTDLEDPEADDMLDELDKYTTGVIRDKQLVREGGNVYAKIVTRDADGSHTQYRSYLRDGYITVYIFDIHKEENYKDSAKTEVYNELINSFTLGFDANDPDIKDITVIKNGNIQYVDKDYGISLDVPKDWYLFKMQNMLIFFQPDNEYELYFNMSSLTDGDTVEQWADRHSRLFEEDFEESYRGMETTSKRRIANEIAIARKIDFSHGGTWRQYTDIFVIKDKYKYNFTFEYDRDDYKKFSSVMERIISSIRIDTSEVDSSFGYVEDRYDRDRSALRTISIREFKYSVKVPRYWSEGADHDGKEVVEMTFNGGSFKIVPIRHSTLNDAITLVEYTFNQTRQVNSKFRVVANTPVTVNGASGRLFEVTGETDGIPYVSALYVLERNNIVYFVSVNMNVGVRSAENLKRVNDVMESLTFTN